MFSGATAGGLVAGPATGNILTDDPAALIGEGSLVIGQINDLQSQLNQKHPLFGVGDLPQSYVSGLVNDLVAKASSVDLANGLATKEPTIAEGGLVQSKDSSLVSDLAAKASSAD